MSEERSRKGICKVEVDKVNKIFNESKGESVVALEDISFKVDEGKFLVILGPSGCGKTTLLRIIAGLELPTNGKVSVSGNEVHGPGRDRGMVFQSYTSFPWLTVRKNIEFGLKLGNMGRNERKDRVDEYITKVGLEGFEKSYPHQLSGGMNQRVAIARTLANDPDVLLMDEPFGALDAQTRWQMQELLLDVWEAEKKTVIFVTHDVEEAVFLADRICILASKPGRIKEFKDVTKELGRERDLNVKTDKKFADLESEVLAIIRADAMSPPPDGLPEEE